ncbi:response regulator transcription factor [Gemmatimonas sp. UBA7669]|uniref:response regulator transcription factor n=1 Tax=Gemmatimonas sp. UBA7669 TaxID=1946568 RepID=UPI0025BEF349|nr:response regulator transcription factor [Gemmatimonas sp. UBA7669]
MTRILVIEDNADLAFAVTTALQSEGFDVAVAGTGPDGVDRARQRDADLIILDLMLPGFDGYRVIRELRGEGIEAPILVLTARGEEADKVRGLRLGADDYVTKPFGAMELLARVEALLRRARHSVAASPSARFGDIVVNRPARSVARAGTPVALTPKEYELLVALMDRAGSVVTRGDLLRAVWGYQQDVSTRTVDIHISELRAKLEPVPAKPVHIITVRKVGYRFEV